MDNYDYKKKLIITKIVVFVLILGISVRGKKISTWPIMNWPVYTTFSRGFPESTASAVELRVYSKSGDLYILKPKDIMPIERASISEKVLNYAFSHDNSRLENKNRVYLAQTITRIFKYVELDSIQAWKLIWNVSPLDVPPLIKNKPTKEVFLGSFLIKDYVNVKLHN